MSRKKRYKHHALVCVYNGYCGYYVGVSGLFAGIWWSRRTGVDMDPGPYAASIPHVPSRLEKAFTSFCGKSNGANRPLQKTG